MNSERFEQFKDKLEKEREEIEIKITELAKPVDFGSDVDAGDEETDETTEFVNQLSVAQVLKERLTAIDHALGKFSDGKYGVCENCGREISTTVLDLAPESKLCQECKKAASD